LNNNKEIQHLLRRHPGDETKSGDNNEQVGKSNYVVTTADKVIFFELALLLKCLKVILFQRVSSLDYYCGWLFKTVSLLVSEE
jgi:hypothetical protein